jgi:hypothetical protein
MSLLTIVQGAADAIGIERPTYVVGNAAPTARQMLALANLDGKALTARTQWQELIKTAVHTTIASENQGALSTIAPGFKYIVNQTIWNRSQDTPVFGPSTPQRWQAYQAAPITGPYYTYRIINGYLHMIPAPSAGMTIAFEYMSENWCQNSGATTTYSAWNADTDTGILSEELLTLGLIWRFKKAKELDYGEDMINYETRVSQEIGRNGGAQALDMTNPDTNLVNYPLIQEGNWPLGG